MQPSQEIFEVLFPCDIVEGEISVTWNPFPAPLPRSLSRSINLHWHAVRGQRSPDTMLFNGPLCRLDSYSLEKDHLRLWLSKTSYKHLLYCNDHALQVIGCWGEEYLSHALGISAVVSTADGHIPIMRRSIAVGEFPGSLDVFGGHINPDKDIAEDAPDPFCGMKAELYGELGIAPNDIAHLSCIGMVKNTRYVKPELVFAAHIGLTLQEVKETAFAAVEAMEFSDIISFADDKCDLCGFLSQHQQELTPSAHGSLYLYGIRREFW